MKKRRILLSVLSLMLIVAAAFGVMSVPGAAATSLVEEGDWINAPAKALVQCPGGDCTHENCYAYSFAVVGDTQNLNIKDVEVADTDYMATLYNWILANQSSKNIQYVLGLGDITQAYHRGYHSGVWVDEWENAALALSLLDGKLDYSLVRGNHDLTDATEGFNGVFGKGDKLVDGVDNQYYENLLALSAKNDAEGRPMAGLRNPDKIEDTYRKIEAGGHKYIIFTLDWHPSKAGDACLAEGEQDCLTWIDEILAANSDYKAIITTHSFLWYEGSITDDVEDVFPYENTDPDANRPNWVEVSESGGNATPDELWGVLRKHSNVEIVLCGHVDSDDIVTTQLQGDNGNTVTCMLIDGQTIDSTIEPVGLVAMFYVKPDGSVMNVEYISTVRAAAGKNAYLKADNQFEVTLDHADAWTRTEYGPIPTATYNAYPFHVILDDDSDNGTTNTLFGSYSSWEETLAAIHAFNGQSNIASRKLKTYNIVLAEDYTYSNEITSNQLDHNQACNNPGKTVLDLQNHTLILSSGTTFLPMYNAKNTFNAAFTVKNGNIIFNGTSKGVVTQHGHPTNASGSVVDIDLTNLNVTYASGATGSLVHPFSMASKSETRSTVNLNVTNCNIDASSAGALVLFNLKDGYNDNNVQLNITGGSFKGTTSDSTVFLQQNWPGDNVTFLKDADGNYTTFTYFDNVELSGVFSSETDGEYLEFGAATESSGKYVYTLAESSSVITKYGVIPTEYQDTSAYPFLIFKDGVVIHAASNWKTLIDTDIKDTAAYQSGCTILLQRDYSTSEASGSPSWFARIDDITIDLNEKTFTRGSYHMIQLFGTEATAHETNITITNGTIKSTASTAPIVYNNANSNTTADSLNMVLNGITFDFSTVTSQEQGIVVAFGDGTEQGISSTLIFNDCTFYRGSSTRTVTLFSLVDEKTGKVNNKTDSNIIINGGKLVADTLTGITFATYSPIRDGMSASADTVMLGTGSNGEEFTVVVPEALDVSEVKFALTAGNHALINNSEDTTGTSYVLRNVSTAYGDIPVEYLDETAYPFVVFKNGEVIYAFSDWYSFIQTDVYGNEVYQSGCTVLLRRDYTTGTDSTDSPSYFHVITDMTLDLGGNVFSRGSKHMFQFIGYGSTSYTVTMTVKNGTIRSAGSLAPVGFNNNSKNTGIDYFNITFEGVTFDVSVNTTGIVACFKDGTQGSVNNVVFDNCKIVRGSSTSKQTLFSLVETAKTTGGTPENKVDVTVTLKGGSFEATTLTGLTFAALSVERVEGKGSPDSIVFAEDSNGTAFTVRVPKSYSVPTSVFNFAADEYEFTKASEDGSYAYYTFVSGEGGEGSEGDSGDESPDFVVEGYGTVPAAYADKETYPILVFYNEKFVEGYTTFTNAIAKAKELVDTAEERAACDTVYIVMRDNVDSISEQINLMTLLGKIVVDLQGNTLCNDSTSTKGMINSFINYNNVNSESVAQANLSNPAEISFKNGIIRNEGSYHMFGFDMTANSVIPDGLESYSAKQITYNFDNVEFQAVKKEIMRNWSKSGEGINAYVNINNCTFNFTDSVSNLAMLNCTGVDIVYNIKITGETKVIASALNNYSIYKLAANDKLSIGGSVILTQSTDTAPTFSYTTEEGVACVFAETASSDTAITYKLIPEAMVGYSIKTSVTLYSNFVYNVYIPVANVSGFTVNGKTVEYTTEMIDGVECYVVKVDIPASETLEDILVCVTLNSGEGTVDAKWTLSVYKYAKSVLDGDYDETTKALMKDMLVYASAAHTYFGNTEAVSDKLAQIKTLLGDYTRELPTGEAKKPADDTYFTDVAVYLGAVPSFRFYLADGYTADDFSFRVGGKSVETIVGEGYVEIVMYAYMMLDDVTFTVNGTDVTESYNLYSYYEYAKTLNDANLVAIVEGLMKYSASAKAYRASVIGK